MDLDYEQFITTIRQKTGIDLALYKETQMKRRLTSLRDKKGFNRFSTFFNTMMKDEELFYEFLDRMTINVSEFYRNQKRWEILEKKVLPDLLQKDKRLKVWSAACSTGEEPYTIAMILSKFIPLRDMSILATDIDRAILERAKVGFYTERSLREIPTDIKSKYLEKNNPGYSVSAEIKKTVTFKQHNLLADRFDQNYDLIICRNVMIYFTEDAKNLLYKKFSEALRPGGMFFVGSTEQIFSPSIYNFETEDTFFYRKKR